MNSSKSLPSAFLDKRKIICNTIGSLPPKASMDVIIKTLVPVLNGCEPPEKESALSHRDVQNLENDLVTPLMLICDKNQLSCLHYIEHRITTDASDNKLWGQPLDLTSKAQGKNSAMHLAGMSGFTVAIDYLYSIGTKMKDFRDVKGSQWQMKKNQDWDPFLYCMNLVTQRNIHRDTPLMMIAASGNADCMRHWTTFIAEQISKSNFGCQDIKREAFKKTFLSENKAGETALSLACGHGHFRVLEFLIGVNKIFPGEETRIVPVTNEDIDHLNATFDRIESLRMKMDNGQQSTQKTEFLERFENMKRCSVLLQESVDHSASKIEPNNIGVGQDIHLQEINSTDLVSRLPPKKGNRKSKKKKKKRSKSKGKIAQTEIDAPSAKMEAESSKESRPEQESTIFLDESASSESSSTSRIVTLKDGTAICNTGRQHNVNLKETTSTKREIVHKSDSKTAQTYFDPDGLEASKDDNTEKQRPLGSQQEPTQNFVENISTESAKSRNNEHKLQDINLQEMNAINRENVSEKGARTNYRKKGGPLPKAKIIQAAAWQSARETGISPPGIDLESTKDANSARGQPLQQQILKKTNSDAIVSEERVKILEEPITVEDPRTKSIILQGASSILFPTTLGDQPRSVEGMLRERHRERQVGFSEMNNHSVDSVMDALCLDASMLLLSSHGMAMKLSPAQLDAITGILNNQMDAVEQARAIQSRLLK